MKWIDLYVNGLVEICSSNDVFDIYNNFNIQITEVEEDSFILQGHESMYIRNYFEVEVVFIRSDLPYKYKKFILAHELGHAMLHIELAEASYNKNLINKGKLEKQADYFALKLLDIKIDEIKYEGFTVEQIAKDLYINEESLHIF